MSNKVILEEEEYVEALGQIIERDFFPDLPKLKRQTELLQDEEHLTCTNKTLRVESTRGITLMHSNLSGSGWDHPTDRSIKNDLERYEEDKDADNNANALMTLNHFVATHTSEDNESFNELQEKAVKDHRRRYHWAFDDNEEKGDPKLHLLTDGTWISHEQRQIADEARALKGPKDDRPSAPDTWKYRARNPLLFSPELEATGDICGIKAGSKRQLLLVEGGNARKVRSVKPPKLRETIVYANSRFSSKGAKMVEGDNSEKSASPRKDYSLVPMTPVIAPGVDASPLMTWGDIEGTPTILGATPARILNTPSFELQDSSRREKLANRLEAEARHRNINTRLLGTKTPSRKGLKADQTPVSRSVRSRVSGVRSVLHTPLSSDTQLRASYSTPLRPPRQSSHLRRAR
ncbi:unnamed protein product [Peronospora belbahrii]|uniref:Nuclear protein DGCR14 n=1 Tax=Peronospora belbahrii TaxID=622444 RepID=A0AAU9LAM9_9STRA|nr:unnamed protein product [Peronospora belbahrii]CAH0517856.1 unnamed protein product [Peronospora belbahrii]